MSFLQNYPKSGILKQDQEAVKSFSIKFLINLNFGDVDVFGEFCTSATKNAYVYFN